MPPALEDNYNLIRGREESFAYRLAKQVIEKPEATVWLIFLPFLLVFYMQRIQKYKDSVHSFAKGIMKVKIITLDAALEEARTGIFPQERITAGFKSTTCDEKAQSERQKKIEEMEILRQHYLLLLGNQGSSYHELVRRSYGTAGEYRLYLNRLLKAEKEVNEAVVQATHTTPEAREVVVRMENAAEKLREMELEEIFT